MRRARAGLEFVPLAEIGDRPNVMADGAALASTVLTLSHWPGSTTPAPLRHDLSAGMAFRYLRSRRRWPAAAAVTSDHFDQDGLVPLAALTVPGIALAAEDALLAVAEAGDFVRGRDLRAARVSFALASLAERRDGADDANPALAGALHREALALLPELMARPERYAELWGEEDRFLGASEESLRTGAVTLSDVPEVDLVVVSVQPGATAPGQAAQFTHRRTTPVHPMAVHNRSDRTRVLIVAPPRYELYFRYETWVQLVSRRPPARVDLAGLAGELTALEPSGREWTFSGAGATVARLGPAGGTSELSPEVVRPLVTDALARGRPAWDPYAAPRPG
jgi:hypothetical protein